MCVHPSLYLLPLPTLTLYPQFADVNAFLTLAATQHTLRPEELEERPRIAGIVESAKAGVVPVHLVSSKHVFFVDCRSLISDYITVQTDLSEKNPLEVLYDTDTIVELLGVFAKGTHRGELHRLHMHKRLLSDKVAPSPHPDSLRTSLLPWLRQ